MQHRHSSSRVFHPSQNSGSNYHHSANNNHASNSHHRSAASHHQQQQHHHANAAGTPLSNSTLSAIAPIGAHPNQYASSGPIMVPNSSSMGSTSSMLSSSSSSVLGMSQSSSSHDDSASYAASNSINAGSASSSDSSAKSNFSVVIRVRPPLPRELSLANYRNVIQCINEHNIAISENHQDSTYNTHLFTFDHVYDENSTQLDVYQNTAKMAVMDTIKGYNATVCAFGQTSSGKTFTLLGADGHIPPTAQDSTSPHPPSPELHDKRGIIPRATEEIFNYIQTKGSSSTKFLVRASYLQIYNDVISDLLKPERSHLKIRQDKKRGVFVENLSEWVVRSPSEIYGLLARGAQVRVEGSTRMNDKSSRSHAVFIIILEQSETTVVNEHGEEVAGCDIDTWKRLPKSQRKGELKQVFKIGKLNLVDLAGSERQRFSGATGVRFDESKQINKSLSALGHVIKRLTSGHPKSHVPYRDSKLTRLLQDSLGGNCKTTMVINISPACFAESLSALKFANRAKTIKNKASINEDLSERALLRKYERELKKLRRELDKKNRDVVDKRRLLQLEEEKRCAEEEKLAALTALEKRSREFMAEKQAKRELEKKIVMMTSNLLVGGEKIEETPQFRKLLNKEFQRVHREYANRLQEIERERQSIDEDKAQVDRYKQLLLKQRDIMIALTARLNERDETIISLQEELDVYDAHQQMLEQSLDRKTSALMEMKDYVAPGKAREAQRIMDGLGSERSAEQQARSGAMNSSNASTDFRGEVEQLRMENQQQKNENDRLRAKLSHIVQGKENNSAVLHLQEENKQLQMRIQQLMNNGAGYETPSTPPSSSAGGAINAAQQNKLNRVVGSLNGDVQRMMDSIYKSVCELQDSNNMPKVVKAKSAIAELTRTMERNTNELKACVKGVGESNSYGGSEQGGSEFSRSNPQGILKSSNGQHSSSSSSISNMPSRDATKHVSFMTPRSQQQQQQKIAAAAEASHHVRY